MDSKRGESGSSLLVYLLLLVFAVPIACGGPSPSATTPLPSPTPSYEQGGIPEDVERRALDEFQAEFGNAEEVYGRYRTSLRSWRSSEQSNAAGEQRQPEEQSRPIYIIFVRGDFTVSGPIVYGDGTPSPAGGQHVAGRIVVDAAGIQLNVQLWGKRKPPEPPIGERFDDK